MKIGAGVRLAYDQLQFKAIWRSPSWFFKMHLPYVFSCLYKGSFLPAYKTPAYNSRMWDGFTRNDFIRGDLILFLYKLRAIKRYRYGDDPDNRSYFIGWLDD